VLSEAGFRNIRWHDPVIPKEHDRGEKYWELYLRCPILLVLECEK